MKFRDQITPEEWAQLSAADRAEITEQDRIPDIHEDEGDDRFGDLLYDNVFGPNGELLT